MPAPRSQNQRTTDKVLRILDSQKVSITRDRPSRFLWLYDCPRLDERATWAMLQKLAPHRLKVFMAAPNQSPSVTARAEPSRAEPSRAEPSQPGRAADGARANGRAVERRSAGRAGLGWGWVGLC